MALRHPGRDRGGDVCGGQQDFSTQRLASIIMQELAFSLDGIRFNGA